MLLSRKTLLGHEVVFMLILHWSGFIQMNGLTVAPPEEVEIHDQGRLGQLLITWSPPASLLNRTDCTLRYQLEYLNSYNGRWTAIRTVRRSYRAQFDLEKAVKVRLYTLLKGASTNYSEIQSNFTDLTVQPSNTGVIGSRVQGFSCVFHQQEYLECTWLNGPDVLAKAQYNLYFWHSDMEHSEECPSYIVQNRARTGCNLSHDLLEEFTDFNICVNSSSPGVVVRPAFFSLQVQNQVKPAAVEVIDLWADPDGKVKLYWDPPHGRVPEGCLEWEVEISEEIKDRPLLLRTSVTRDTTFTHLSNGDTERECFRVRSRVHQFCADRGFWSDWSLRSCDRDIQVVPEQDLDVGVVGAVVGITVLILSLCLVAGWTVCTSQKKKAKLFLSSA
ncbi:interleukin-13 receptor subunit alpha-2 isoform X1 [Hypomesus transpacificus]|uniref:interleukin-13 receptor subunit alpha-2 isoform X1 n=1 Tax=Hypomesus transpacificus TaxID=137520 RepID=UPI001F07E62F|nr:interleukin-13 receptor subunit alpha-2 isoform X1 [Hypomesus transpacificus]